MVLQVGTTNFQSTAGESFRTPVDTFVKPVDVLPKTGLMDLAETLQSINPTLQKFVNFTKCCKKGIKRGEIVKFLAKLLQNPGKLNTLL